MPPGAPAAPIGACAQDRSGDAIKPPSLDLNPLADSAMATDDLCVWAKIEVQQPLAAHLTSALSPTWDTGEASQRVATAQP
jgi:hypothetical protein